MSKGMSKADLKMLNNTAEDNHAAVREVAAPAGSGAVPRSAIEKILGEWIAEADLLRSGNHPRRQRVPRVQVLQEECSLRGCIADVREVLRNAQNS